MSESTRMMLGLILGIVVMVVLVSKTKVHTFIALLAACCIVGIIGGMPFVDVTKDDGAVITGLVTGIQDGFGNTLKSTGIIRKRNGRLQSQDGSSRFRCLQILQS